jgi:hypothetical protein
MLLEGLTSAYSLEPITVVPTQLLLDPTNPRLITEFSQIRSYSPQEIAGKETQEYVLDLVCRKQHDVKHLIASIKEMGFVGGLHEMIVKDMGSGGPYLVLEGNRRTAALRHLLTRESGLRPDVKKSIEKIEVKLFKYKNNSRHQEQKIIDVLLGSIHIDGPKEWGALERSHYIHRSYLRTLGESASFRYDIDVSREVGSSFNMTPKAVHKALIICRVYDQLKSAKLGVDPRHYSLLELATKTRAVADSYFEVDRNRCQLSDVGVERFADLILGNEPLISNPNDFNRFVEIYSDGTPLELEQFLSGEKAAEDICSSIGRRKSRRAFRADLEDIEEKIKELELDQFNNTEAEKTVILRIEKLIEKRLKKLL